MSHALVHLSSGYLVQDFFTKWAEAIPLTDQTAARITGITEELVKLLSTLGIPWSSTQIKDQTSKAQF